MSQDAIQEWQVFAARFLNIILLLSELFKFGHFVVLSGISGYVNIIETTATIPFLDNYGHPDVKQAKNCWVGGNETPLAIVRQNNPKVLWDI